MHHINQKMSSENGIIFTPELPFELFTPDCQSLIRDYECPLCKGVTKDPVVDSCGHIFCKKCFILSFSENQMCPISKVKLTTQPTNVLIITQILEKQKLSLTTLNLCRCMTKIPVHSEPVFDFGR